MSPLLIFIFGSFVGAVVALAVVKYEIKIDILMKRLQQP